MEVAGKHEEYDELLKKLDESIRRDVAREMDILRAIESLPEVVKYTNLTPKKQVKDKEVFITHMCI